MLSCFWPYAFSCGCVACAAVISKHRAAIAEQLPAKRRPVLQKMFEPGSDKGVGDAENEAENDDDDDADDEE